MAGNMSIKESKMCIDGGAIVLDVRTKEEYDTGHIAGSMCIDFYNPQFKEKVEVLDKSRSYVVHCLSGGRSAKAVKMMAEMGFGEAHNMEGGITDWKKEGMPVEK